MKTPVVVLFLAASAWAQDAAKTVAIATPSAALACGVLGPNISPQSFTNLEDRFDRALEKDQFDILGLTRALYLRDYGLTLTSEVSLIQTPGLGPMRREMTPEEKANVHKRKQAQVPILKAAMREMLKASALTLAGPVGLPNYESSGLQVVLAVKVKYLQWETTTGLPGQIVMKASLKNAIAGVFQEEVQ